MTTLPHHSAVNHAATVARLVAHIAEQSGEWTTQISTVDYEMGDGTPGRSVTLWLWSTDTAPGLVAVWSDGPGGRRFSCDTWLGVGDPTVTYDETEMINLVLAYSGAAQS